MQTRPSRFVSPLMLVGILIFCPAASAQFQNPITAAKDAWKKAQAQARQQQAQQRQQQQQQQSRRNANPNSTLAAASQPANGAANSDTGAISDSECCTPAAMQEYARRASVLDVVGIKLGMTPQQAFAAVHAFDPKLKIDIIKTQMEVPGLPESQYPWIPRGAIAHTVGPNRPVAAFLLPDQTPVYSMLPDLSSDVIQIEFTTPPNPPLVARITRTIRFPNGRPVLASALMAGLRKKYGQENSPGAAGPMWIYGPDGNLLQRQLTQDESRLCSGAQPGSTAFQLPTSLGDRVTVFTLRWDNHAKLRSYNPRSANGYGPDSVNSIAGEATPVCVPFTLAMAGQSFTSPNEQVMTITVGVASPALEYASYRSTQEWMEAKAEAAQQKEQQSVKKNAAPKF